MFHHPAPAGSGFKSEPIASTWSNEFQAFLSSQAVKMALWFRRLPF